MVSLVFLLSFFVHKIFIYLNSDELLFIRGGTDGETGGYLWEPIRSQRVYRWDPFGRIPCWRGTCRDSGCRHVHPKPPIIITSLFFFFFFFFLFFWYAKRFARSIIYTFFLKKIKNKKLLIFLNSNFMLPFLFVLPCRLWVYIIF